MFLLRNLKKILKLLKMKLVLQLLYAVLTFLALVTYNIISSLIFIFVPRNLRSKKNIEGQRVLITGAGSGVGRELAIEFSKHATCLILVDINKQSLIETEKLLDRCSTVFIYNCDVSDYKKVYEMAERVQIDAGDVDILVNNAGIVNGKFLLDLSEEKIVRTLEVNTLAHFWTCKAFLPAMIQKNRGHIVSIVSVGGKSGCPRLTDYCASKYAALGFAESLEMELRIQNQTGIKITTVCPSIIRTDLFKGAELKFSPSLSPKYVASEVVNGVLEDEEMIVLPHYFKFLLRVKELVPRWIALRVHEITTNINIMDKFVGREQLENGTDEKNSEKKSE